MSDLFVGQIAELVVCYLLGMISSIKPLKIDLVSHDDAKQVDLRINGCPIQLKLGWREDSLHVLATKMRLEARGITVVCLQLKEDGLPTSGIDVVRSLVVPSAMDSTEFEELIENEIFDEIETIWDWFVKASS